MNKRASYILIGFIAVAVLAGLWYWSVTVAPASTDLDAFAQCLTDQGVVMYGADWCSHCQNEKRSFGQSFRLINYVECPDNPQRCIDASIAGYPTWILGGGRKLEGEQGIDRLAAASGCSVVQ
jgi:hypothetical protein